MTALNETLRRDLELAKDEARNNVQDLTAEKDQILQENQYLKLQLTRYESEAKKNALSWVEKEKALVQGWEDEKCTFQEERRSLLKKLKRQDRMIAEFQDKVMSSNRVTPQINTAVMSSNRVSTPNIADNQSESSDDVTSSTLQREIADVTLTEDGTNHSADFGNVAPGIMEHVQAQLSTTKVTNTLQSGIEKFDSHHRAHVVDQFNRGFAPANVDDHHPVHNTFPLKDHVKFAPNSFDVQPVRNPLPMNDPAHDTSPMKLPARNTSPMKLSARDTSPMKLPAHLVSSIHHPAELVADDGRLSRLSGRSSNHNDDNTGRVSTVDGRLAPTFETDRNDTAPSNIHPPHVDESITHASVNDRRHAESDSKVDIMSHGLHQSNHHRRSSSDNIAIPNVGGHNQNVSNPLNDLSPDVQGLFNSLCKHNRTNCTICTRITSCGMKPTQKKTVTIERPIPVTDTINAADTEDADLTLRPAVDPGLALATVIKGLGDEMEHLRSKIEISTARYHAVDPRMDSRNRKALRSALDLLQLNLDRKADQIYALYDVLEGQKAAGQTITQDEVDVTILSITSN